MPAVVAALIAGLVGLACAVACVVAQRRRHKREAASEEPAPDPAQGGFRVRLNRRPRRTGGFRPCGSKPPQVRTERSHMPSSPKSRSSARLNGRVTEPLVDWVTGKPLRSQRS